MKKHLIALSLTLTAGLFAPNLNAEDWFAPSKKGGDAAANNANWLTVGPQFGLNINARFDHAGNVNPASPGPATGSGVDRTYNDGFVHVDSSGDAGSQTWNWGYQNAPQAQGSTLTMHSASIAAAGKSEQNSDLNPGFDLAFGHRLGTVLGGSWGVQAAFDFTDISIDDNHPLSGTGTLISDAFSLGRTTPPQAPYSGSFNGPGPLLGDSPTRTTMTDTIQITGQRKLDAQVCALRAGPYFEFPFGKQWSGRFGGGLAVAIVETSYSYNETMTFGSGPVINSTGSSSGAEVGVGGYLDGKLLYAVTPETSFFAGAQYEYLGKFSRTAGGEQAQLDMNSAVYLLLGVQVSF